MQKNAIQLKTTVHNIDSEYEDGKAKVAVKLVWGDVRCMICEYKRFVRFPHLPN